ncbi:MAG TPA: tetratricopeptide repeat protein [Pyrinomonadaceae bacterium]|nr:tetratricopeptide repeat protein [Pyrinomonadaceae bacterium]
MIGSCFPVAVSQGVDGEDDPVKLFERGQDAHARNDYQKAIEFYEAAIKLKPEFPEAEFQRAMALLVTNRKQEAIEGFKRAVALRPDWALAYSKFGTYLGSYGNDQSNAEPILRRAIELDSTDINALVVLAEIRQHAGDSAEALKLVRAATSLASAKSWTWRKRSFIERANNDLASALASLDKALLIDPGDLGARHDRALLRLEAADREGAFADIQALEKAGHGSELSAVFELAQLYDRAGKREDALRILDTLPEKDRSVPEVIALRDELTGGDGSSSEGRAAMEQLLARDPRNAGLLARLGAAYRRVDPVKSVDFYFRALQLEPNNVHYAIGYAAALNQARRFAEAVTVLRAVLTRAPDEYLAHTNLALALYELKDFRAAIVEYKWIAEARPELSVTYFFLATAHDNLREYEPALDAYEKFLAKADPAANKLEIEKINLRLPILRRQIKRGEGVKPKRP